MTFLIQFKCAVSWRGVWARQRGADESRPCKLHWQRGGDIMSPSCLHAQFTSSLKKNHIDLFICFYFHFSNLVCALGLCSQHQVWPRHPSHTSAFVVIDLYVFEDRFIFHELLQFLMWVWGCLFLSDQLWDNKLYRMGCCLSHLWVLWAFFWFIWSKLMLRCVFVLVCVTVAA